ncbi:MAG: hypothetical protein ACHQ1F_10595 [Spirochaetia bacterium]
MKRILAVLIVTLMPSLLFAGPEASPWQMGFPGMLNREAGPYVKSEISMIDAEMNTKKLGDFSVGDLVVLRDRLSVAEQKDRYVDRIATESFFLPGLGQFQTGDTASGMAFLTLDLAAIAGTLVAVYYCLPADLRFNRIDYFRDSASTIRDTWNGHSFTDFLPACGALLGGLIVDQTIRHWASAHAKGEAVQAVDQGKVQFTPRIGIGFMGFGLEY